jgi:4-hydroxybenzoate-CoA ligase/benzoate-CoA ligase
MIDDSSAAALVYSPEFSGEVEPAIAAAARPPRYVLRTEGEGHSLASLLAQSHPQFDAVPTTAEDDCFWL